MHNISKVREGINKRYKMLTSIELDKLNRNLRGAHRGSVGIEATNIGSDIRHLCSLNKGKLKESSTKVYSVSLAANGTCCSRRPSAASKAYPSILNPP